MDRDAFEIGEPVVDRDSPDDDPNTAIVVNCPPQAADDWTAYRNTTVAEDNPDYPEDASVAIVVYRHELAEFDPDWAERDGPFPLAELNEAGVSHYSYPVPRLRSLATDDSGEPDETDEEGENADTGNEDQTESDPTETSTDADQTDSEPSADVRTLKERLIDCGLAAEIEPDGHTVVTEKLGVTYRLTPGELLEGDGPHRDQIEEIAADV